MFIGKSKMWMVKISHTRGRLSIQNADHGYHGSMVHHPWILTIIMDANNSPFGILCRLLKTTFAAGTLVNG